jgi:hypothetical protein
MKDMTEISLKIQYIQKVKLKVGSSGPPDKISNLTDFLGFYNGE